MTSFYLKDRYNKVIRRSRSMSQDVGEDSSTEFASSVPSFPEGPRGPEHAKSGPHFLANPTSAKVGYC